MTRLKLATVFAIGALSYAISGSFANADEERRQHGKAEADAIFFNGKVITLEDVEQRKHKTKIVRAFAVKDGRYLAVGDNDDVMRFSGRNTRKVNLKGRTVIPGLADGHFHSTGGGPGMALPQTRSLADLFPVVAKAAQTAAPGQILVSNSDWHEAQLAEQRLPLASELDISAPNNPVVLVRGGHEFILNNVALRLFNITLDTPVPAGGAIPRTPDGQLNGELVDNARQLVTLPPPPPQTPEQQRQALLDTQSRMNSMGVTAVRNALSSVAVYRRWQALRDEGAISLRNAFLIGGLGTAAAVENFVATSGVQPNEGDDWLRLVGLKFISDGGFEGGLMRDPYKEPYGHGGTYHGLQVVNTANYFGALKAAALHDGESPPTRWATRRSTWFSKDTSRRTTPRRSRRASGSSSTGSSRSRITFPRSANWAWCFPCRTICSLPRLP